jgi:transcriptional antiterminator NusG
VERFLSKESAKQKPRVENLPTYETNTPVKILSGPFADFLGVVASADEQRLKLQVIVNIFGRETPVEMDYHQVELA